MSYQVLARKYRPQRFADVVGQEHVTQTLANAITQNRIAHAYLFVGPRGTGKTTIARIFGKCLRCEKSPTTDPCNECPECRAIAEGRSMDMLEFDAASNTQVEKIRDIIIDHVKYAPSSGKVKLYLVDEVHMLSNSSFNALLKTLEEPPPYVKFLFATTDPEKVPATILSRCQRFQLRRVPSALIARHLAYIAREEAVEIDEPALFAIARGADGGLRDAESTLDQLISFCGTKIVENDVLSMFGLTSRTQLVELAGAILTGETERALRALDALARSGKDLSRLMAELIGQFRNLLLFQVSKGDLSLLEISESEAAQLPSMATLAPPDAVTRVMDVLTDSESRLRDASSKRIMVEVALLRAVQARQAVPIDAVLQRLSQLKDGALPPPTPARNTATPAPERMAEKPSTAPIEPRPASIPAPTVVTPAPATTAMPKVEAAAPPATAPAAVGLPPGTAPDLPELWTRLLDAVGRSSNFTRSYLLAAHPVALAKNLLTIGYDPRHADQVGMVDTPKARALITAKLAELGIADAQVRFIQAARPPGADPVPAGEPPAPATTAAPQPHRPAPAPSTSEAARTERTPPPPLNKEDFKNDPLIKQALEIFKGTIVEVRGT